MRPYELVVLLHPDLEIDVDTPIAKIEKLAETAGGKVVKRDNWGKKRLAYRVRHQDFAVYVYFELSLDPAKTRGLENNLSLTEEIMRHILVSREMPSARSEAKKAKRTKKADKPELTTVSEEK